jgi:soluble lytic murein transglycosylase
MGLTRLAHLSHPGSQRVTWVASSRGTSYGWLVTLLTRAMPATQVRSAGKFPLKVLLAVAFAFVGACACVSAEPSRPPVQGTAGLLVAPPHSSVSTPGVAVASEEATARPSPIPSQSTFSVAPTANPAEPPLDATTERTFEAFRLALNDRNFASARAWLSNNAAALDDTVQAVVSSIVSLGLDQPEHALQYLRQIDPSLPLPLLWIDELTARSYGRSQVYLTHLPALKRSDSFNDTFAVASRLLGDGRLADCEAFVNRSIGLAHRDTDRGKARFLRAKLRLAQNRPSQAAPDLRWLALSNPHHSDSEQAFALLSQPPFPPLHADDRYLRLNQLADRGMVEATDLAAEALQPLTTDPARQADLNYMRGLARYRKRLFAEAVVPLDRAVLMGSHKADHARYLAARATARAGNPKAAIERFKPIARSTPTTPTVANAAFHIAREHSIAGEWEKAAEAYGEFQTRFPEHEYAKLVEQDLLPVWFASGHHKRVVYWARRLRERDPERTDAALLRSIEALSLSRLGHTEFAKQVWLGLTQASPLSFAGIVARLRLAELGVDVKAPFDGSSAQHSRLAVALPPAVIQLDALGFSRQAEFALQKLETKIAKEFANNADAALCDAYAPLRAGRRRFELGFEAVKRRGFRDSPQLADPWLWNCYYPTPFLDSVLRQTQSQLVSPALVYAVMRQESAFLETVESNAGAHGLMQIIDPTARHIAAELKHAYSLEDLNQPDRNIEFGVFYLNKLQRYFTHPALVAAAYNAGPEATARWFSAGIQLPLEVFVLRIPYEETRTYVQRVLANLAVYQTLKPQFTRVDMPLEFSSVLNDAQALPDTLHSTPEDFY